MPRPSRRREIEDAAIALFAEKGVDGATIRDIAQRAGVSEPAIYRHFQSKEALELSLFAARYEELGEAVLSARAGARDIGEALDRMILAFCRLHDREEATFRFLLVIQHRGLPRLPNDAPNPVTTLRSAIAEAIGRGELAIRDPDLATAIVMGTVLQTAVFHMYGRLSGGLVARASDIAAACRRALGVAPNHAILTTENRSLA